MRALIVTNMYPTPARPALGSFVRDQVQALQRLPRLELELFAFAPGGPGAYLRAAPALRRRFGAAALRRRPRAFRADRVAGAGRPRARPRGDAAWHRSGSPALAAAHRWPRCGAWIWWPPSRRRSPMRFPSWARARRTGGAALRSRPGALRPAAPSTRRAPARPRSKRALPAVRRRPARGPRSATTGPGRWPGDGRAAQPRRRRARAGAAVGQRRQRRARSLRARGLRPGGARGAGLRRAGAGHPGGGARGGAGGRGRDPVRAL